MSLEKAKELLSQLEPKEGPPQHRLLTPGVDVWQEGDEYLDYTVEPPRWMPTQIPSTIQNPGRICRRAESLIIPDAANRVREVIMAAMDAEKDVYETDGSTRFKDACEKSDAFRKLCEPKVKP